MMLHSLRFRPGQCIPGAVCGAECEVDSDCDQSDGCRYGRRVLFRVCVCVGGGGIEPRLIVVCHPSRFATSICPDGYCTSTGQCNQYCKTNTDCHETVCNRGDIVERCLSPPPFFGLFGDFSPIFLVLPLIALARLHRVHEQHLQVWLRRTGAPECVIDEGEKGGGAQSG